MSFYVGENESMEFLIRERERDTILERKKKCLASGFGDFDLVQLN